ncbi:MAG: bifunctional D-glycero-beta-D-manno-heptose-7-phosphate kinase/D-glycero-beta-D-manno-heptose 1-phosphate adenylyltransferase HldE [Ectothiorhodospiraceae bacterium]|nr:bifunctional D-glycero-beta-D-manno-heptose-7-phosphate kinase/D-glycero-beta-D-manno-heptose 1-phosphate adenylyltransferase HldE [Ectothiorhodospiraceae bacterium]
MQLTLPDFSLARVVVIGDLMLDRYWYGDTARVSPEAPVPVVRVGGMEERPGGAANVALNIAALHGAVGLLGLTGEDEAAATLQRELTNRGVHCDFLAVANHPTICKLRVMSRRQQLIRLDFEQPFGAAERQGLDQRLAAAVEGADVVVLSDYAKGPLAGASGLIAVARKAGCRVRVDPKGQDFDRYRGADLLTPNLSEFEGVTGPCADLETLEVRARALIAALDLGGLLITRGERGMSLITADGPPLHLPAHAREVYDVTGAGDTVISVLAAALAAGSELPVATALANVAAGLVVGKVGTASVTVAELRRALHGLQAADHGPVTREQLRVLVEDARTQGERIVLTNGCFDLLHAGHVAYLQQARALGDRLIVAGNDDASVRRLKGPQRPVTPLEQRMAVLSGLAAVDWVVSFGEDTPAELIADIVPDVLVKGGDYAPDRIAGAETVRDAGGDVVVLDFVDGVSTTSIVERIRKATDSGS